MNLRETTRLKIWLAVLGVFVLGAVTGVALDRAYHLKASGHGMAEQHDRENFLETLQHRLDLNEQQATQVRAIMDETRNEYRQLRADMRPRYDASRQKARTRIRALLTPEQQQKFDAMTAERDAHRDEEDKNRP
jgi:Spy/CpxP family protein refolding chaperone